MDESGNHKQAEQRERIRWIVSILIPLLCALLSFCVIAKYTSSPTMKINAHAIQSLDDKKTTALELTAAATAASAAITLIPGDAGTPIADKLADLSSYFLIVVCAIYLEKYLVTITGLAAFKLLIPIGCILLSLCFGFKKDLGRTIACKLVLFGLAVYLVVPVSVRVADLMDAQTNPTLAPYAKTGEVHFRVTARACSEEAAEKLMEPMIEEMKKRFGDAVYTTEENVTLEESVIRLLEEKKMTVTTAESCTGGKLSGRLLNVSGASGVYNEGYITYANASKEKILGVKHETLETYGAVSEQTAAEMALGAAKAAGADAALSVTGIAGPGGGTAEKPVGLVYIGCAVKGEVTVREYRFTGNREKNRDYAVARAITLLREELLKRA